MSEHLTHLTPTQKFWHAKLVISAVLADGAINRSEVEYLKLVLAKIADNATRLKLMGMIETKKAPPLTPPDKIAKDSLAAIFLELVLVLISDIEFAPTEKAFLRQVAELFGFSPAYEKEMMTWCNDGLEWKRTQLKLIGTNNLNELSLNIKTMDSDQRFWYAKTLVGAIIKDGEVDRMEVGFLRAAISIIKEPKAQLKLKSYIKNRTAPPMSRPPHFDLISLRKVMLEVIQIISADESMSYTEQNYLTQLGNLCKLTKGVSRDFIKWGEQGVAWKQRKAALINQARGTVAKPKGNAAMVQRKLVCQLCDSEQVTFWQLKSKTQKTRRNIFGIPVYQEALPGYQQVNHHYLAVILCPDCLFASLNKNNFKKDRYDKGTGLAMHADFLMRWQSELKKRTVFLGEHSRFIGQERLKLETVERFYRLVVASTSQIAHALDDPEAKWELIHAKLILAQVLMEASKAGKAENLIEECSREAATLFKTTKSNLVSLRAARLLALIGLYKKDRVQSSNYYEFFRKMERDQERFNPSDAKLFIKMNQEIRRIFQDRELYAYDKLDGFELEA